MEFRQWFGGFMPFLCADDGETRSWDGWLIWLAVVKDFVSSQLLIINWRLTLVAENSLHKLADRQGNNISSLSPDHRLLTSEKKFNFYWANSGISFAFLLYFSSDFFRCNSTLNLETFFVIYFWLWDILPSVLLVRAFGWLLISLKLYSLSLSRCRPIAAYKAEN